MKPLIRTLGIVFTLFITLESRAGVFNIPQFVDYKSWAVGAEPEVTLSNYSNTGSSGAAMNVKFTYGMTPLSNLQVGIGGGSGSKEFRLGSTYTFDIIPDLEGQIGAGIAFQAYYYKLKAAFGQTETTIYPYLHKMFSNEGLNYDPYLAMPYGVAFYDGTYRSIWQLVVGNYFKTSAHFGFNVELGLNLKDTDTYFSTGVTYRD
jgi:hypothetical protein